MDEQPWQNVIVRDIHMSFGAMVAFMIKWAIAAIPAMLILGVAAAIVAAVFGGIISGIMGG